MGFNDDAIVNACRDFEIPSVASTILKGGSYDIALFAMDSWLA